MARGCMNLLLVRPLLPVVIRPNKRSHVVSIFEDNVRISGIGIRDDVAKFFMIDGITIDRTLQTVSAHLGLPAAAFSSLAIGVALDLDAMQEGSTFDLIVRNVGAHDQELSGSLYGAVDDMFRFAPNDAEYHAFIERRQAIYESIHEHVDPEERDDVFFNGQQIFADTFSPKTRRWWVDKDGYEVRPVYGIEDVSIGGSKGGLRVVDLDTYEGFE